MRAPGLGLNAQYRFTPHVSAFIEEIPGDTRAQQGPLGWVGEAGAGPGPHRQGWKRRFLFLFSA